MRQPGLVDYPAKPLGNIAVEQVGDDVELAFDKGQLRNIEMLTMTDARKLHSLLGQVVEPRGQHIDAVFDIVIDGPPSHESGRFVDVEDADGRSIQVGDWVQRDDGYWVLRLPDPRPPRAAIDAVLALHTPVDIEPSETICHECSWQLPNGQYFGKLVEWPCPTVQALTDALGVEPSNTGSER
jgi:hypothetical protein